MPRIHNTVDLIQDLSDATDYELAIAYYWCDDDEARYPLYLIKDEMDNRSLTFDDIEGLILADF